MPNGCCATIQQLRNVQRDRCMECVMAKTDRISEDVLAEHWYSFMHQLIGRMQEAFRTARREDSELSQKTIAEKLGKPAPFISRCLSGQQNMTIRTIYYIARAMGYRLEITFRPLKSIRPSNFDEN